MRGRISSSEYILNFGRCSVKEFRSLRSTISRYGLSTVKKGLSRSGVFELCTRFLGII